MMWLKNIENIISGQNNISYNQNYKIQLKFSFYYPKIKMFIAAIPPKRHCYILIVYDLYSWPIKKKYIPLK